MRPPTVKEALTRLQRYQEVPRPAVDEFGARLRRAARWRLALLRGRPFWASDLHSSAFQRELMSTLHSFQPDAVQVEFSAMGQYLDVLDTRLMPRVLVEHDPTFALQSRKDGWGQGRCQTRAWRGLAANVLRRVDRVVVPTSRVSSRPPTTKPSEGCQSYAPPSAREGSRCCWIWLPRSHPRWPSRRRRRRCSPAATCWWSLSATLQRVWSG